MGALNQYRALHDYAVDQNWCLAWPCTTCAAQDLRSELTRWLVWDPRSFLNAIRELGPEDRLQMPEYDRMVTITHFTVSSLVRNPMDPWNSHFFALVPTRGSYVASSVAKRTELDTAARSAEHIDLWQQINASLPSNPRVDDFDWYDSYSARNQTAREVPTTEVVAAALAQLKAAWSEVAGAALRDVTTPLLFSGRKRRRLLVKADASASPPWGSWLKLMHSRGTFSELRSKVNAAISPHEVDHIDFTTK